MKKFIIGYKNAGDEFLTEFATKIQADFEAEEWCEVEAENLDEAKLKYETEFENWNQSFHIGAKNGNLFYR